MTNFYKYEVVVVKFPFASSLKYKARPAVIISNSIYNQTWQEAGLLKPSLFKMSIATISQENILHRLGSLQQDDIERLNTQLERMCL